MPTPRPPGFFHRAPLRLFGALLAAGLLSACTPPDAPELATLGSRAAQSAPFPRIAPLDGIMAQGQITVTPADTAAIQAQGAETERRARALQNRQLD